MLSVFSKVYGRILIGCLRKVANNSMIDNDSGGFRPDLAAWGKLYQLMDATFGKTRLDKVSNCT